MSWGGKVDNVTLNVLNSGMISICRDMGHTLMRTAYSSIFNEGLDFTCAIATLEGEMLASAEFCPAQIGAMPVTIEACAQEIDKESLKPGDVIVHNDPYRGGCHIPEHSFFAPVFFEDELVAITTSIGHVAEVGGKAPAAFAGDATEIFQEGIRLPPIKLISKGKDVLDIWKLILANVRTPRFNYGDFRALSGSVIYGANKFVDFMKKYGKNKMLDGAMEILNYSERRMRAEIREMPNGEYEWEDYVDDDGVADIPYKIKVSLTIKDEEILVDYTGTDKQAAGPINATYGVTVSATYNALLHATDPDIPKNSGCFRPIKIIAPKGTVVNVDYPGPEVGGNTETHPLICNIVWGALSKAIPGKVPASGGTTAMNLAFGGQHPDYKEAFSCYHIEGSGWGGRPWGDGNSMLCVPNGNCRNSPIEVFDTRYPWITHEYRLNTDSGGPGKYRGGMGSTRIIEVNAPEITISALSSRYKNKDWGLFGGHQGTNAGFYIKRKGSKEWKTVKEMFGTVSVGKFSNLKLHKGDMVKMVSPGGGGYGSPRERDRETVLGDLNEGFISSQAAEKEYGLKVEEKRGN